MTTGSAEPATLYFPLTAQAQIFLLIAFLMGKDGAADATVGSRRRYCFNLFTRGNGKDSMLSRCYFAEPLKLLLCIHRIADGHSFMLSR